jgi:SWI/SNF-related matrix-associated actin-dependent regulator 1 of chromatin subfamily A
MRPSLRPYQVEGVCAIQRQRGRALLADEMGLGKTAQTLVWLERTKSFPAVVVCPAAVKSVWEHEAALWLGKRAAVLSGQKPAPFRGKTPDIIVINYEILTYWRPLIASLGAKTLILDECHMIKNRTTLRTKAAQKIARGVPHLIAISGTPVESRPAEIWTTLNLLDPTKYRSFFTFGMKYCGAVKKPWGWEYKKCTNALGLHRELKAVMIRRLKKDVAQDLPEKSRCVVPLTMPDEGRRRYFLAETNFVRWLQTEEGAATAKRAAKAEEVTKLGALRRLIGEYKVELVTNWIDAFLESTDRKLIIFGIHKAMIAALIKKYKGQAVAIHGGVPTSKRGAIVRQFQTNAKTRLFIGQLRAAGAGITLTAASDVVFVEMGWVPAEYAQAEDRPHRIGQKNAVMCHYLVVADTVDEDLCEVVQEKAFNCGQILDGREGEELDIADLLQEKIDRRLDING